MGMGRTADSGDRTNLGRVPRAIQWILTAGHLPADAAVFDGGVLIVETSEELISVREFGYILRSLGERGLLSAAGAVLAARPPASTLGNRPPASARTAYRDEQRDTVIEIVARYNSDAVACVGVPFGHTRPQWIVPYGGHVTVDGSNHRVWADYS